MLPDIDALRLFRLSKAAAAAALVALVALFVFVGSAPAAGQALGIAEKKPVLGAACKVCPWGALADILKTAMQPYGYELQICYNCSQVNAPRIVGDRKLPPPLSSYAGFVPLEMMPAPPNAPVDFGITGTQNVVAAYHGLRAYAKDGPRKQLRLIANIQAPSYVIVAVRADTGITDLSQIKGKPVRVLVGGEAETILAHYGLSAKSIVAAGATWARTTTRPNARSRST